MAPANTLVYYQKGRIGILALVAMSATGFVAVVLYKKRGARKRVAAAFVSCLNQTKLLVKDRELIKLLQLAAKLLLAVAAKISPYWLLLRYEPFSRLLVGTCSLIWQSSFGCLPLPLREGSLWVGYMVYSLTIDPLSQVGGATVCLLLFFGDRVASAAKMLLKPISFYASQLLRGNGISGAHLYRATVRRTALTVYWICSVLEMAAYFVAWCCIGIVALRKTKKGDALWADLQQRYIQPAASKTRGWLLTEDRQLSTRRMLAIVLPLLLFCLTLPPKTPPPSSRGASTPHVKAETILLSN